MRFLFICTLFFIQFVSFGQSKVVWLYNAEEYFQKQDYQNALRYYQKSLDDSAALVTLVKPYEIAITNQKIDKKKHQKTEEKQVPLTDYIRHQIGICYQKTFDYKQAELLFAKTNREFYPEDQFYYANALMNVKKYEQAVIEFENYIRSDNYNDSLLRAAQLSITGCYYAQNEMHFNKEIAISMMDTSVFNKGSSSFAANFFRNENELMFTSARDGGVILDPEKQQSNMLCDVYYTSKNTDGSWSLATNFGRPMNSAQHDAASVMNNKNVMYYTRWSDENRIEQHIFIARMVDFKFYESYKLPESVNVPGYKSIQPFITMDGQWMYFSSNRPGGKGGMDLWKIKLNEQGLPEGEAINFGESINTEMDEVTPFFHEASSTLFFSSNGNNTIGGLDVFKSYFDKENEAFQSVENVGMPINSEKDDAYLIWDSKLDVGYFSSDREPCDAGHCYDIYQVKNAPIKIMLSGVTYDKTSNEILPNVNLTFKDIDGNFSPFNILTDANGFYQTELKQGWEIFIKAKKESYFADAGSVNTKIITESMNLVKDFYLEKIPTGEIEIEGIEYDFNSDKLRPISMQILDKIYDFLVLNDNLVIEINSHTDCRGSDIYNLDLSQRRAKSCVNYLIAKGISKDRIKPMGYGETQPAILLGPDKKPVLDANGQQIILTEAYIKAQKPKAYQEELHQRNRRTAFKVVGEKFDIQSR